MYENLPLLLISILISVISLVSLVFLRMWVSVLVIICYKYNWPKWGICVVDEFCDIFILAVNVEDHGNRFRVVTNVQTKIIFAKKSTNCC